MHHSDKGAYQFTLWSPDLPLLSDWTSKVLAKLRHPRVLMLMAVHDGGSNGGGGNAGLAAMMGSQAAFIQDQLAYSRRFEQEVDRAFPLRSGQRAVDVRQDDRRARIDDLDEGVGSTSVAAHDPMNAMPAQRERFGEL